MQLWSVFVAERDGGFAAEPHGGVQRLHEAGFQSVQEVEPFVRHREEAEQPALVVQENGDPPRRRAVRDHHRLLPRRVAEGRRRAALQDPRVTVIAQSGVVGHALRKEDGEKH